MRLPADSDLWTPHHAERLIKIANRLFVEYERKADLDHPETTEDLFRRWMHVKEEALGVINATDAQYLKATLLNY